MYNHARQCKRDELKLDIHDVEHICIFNELLSRIEIE